MGDYRKGTRLGKERYGEARIHKTAEASKAHAEDGYVFSLTRNPNDQGGSIIHLREEDCINLLHHLEKEYGPDLQYTYEKEVYFDRKWIPASFVSSDGQATEVVTEEFGELEVPFFHVRDRHAKCRECKRRLFRGSFQSVGGDSYCVPCYHELEDIDIELMFHGHQWWSWDGQMAIRQMEQSHIINSLGRLKKNAAQAVEEAGGKMEDYLHPSFKHLVAELRRRRPPEELTKANGILIQLYIVIMMMMGWNLIKDDDDA
jgi:hypothetical protein